MFKPEDRTSPSLQEKQEHAQALQEDKTWDQKKKTNYNQRIDLFQVSTILLKKLVT